MADQRRDCVRVGRERRPVQRFVVERFRPDETSHTQRFASWAAKLFGPKPSRQLPYGALVHKEMLLSSISPRLRFASCVATLCWNEKYALKSARRVVPILSLVDPGLGRTYAEVMDEERAHVEWGLAVIKRMESDRPDIFKMMEVYGNYVRTIYPIIMNHIHPKVYKRVLRESRSATQ